MGKLECLAILVICVSLEFVNISAIEISKLKTSYFDQTIDHFNFRSNSNQTYKQRYLYTDQYWKKGSPMLFYTGNEGDITSFANNTGIMFEFGENLTAYIVFAEHRYYGESLPFGNSSFNGTNIGYLSIEQAMADFAVLIKYLKTKLGQNTPVICFGGSYGGMLSAYMRFKYPNLVLGAIASSAPILSVSNNVPQSYFFEDVTKDFEDVNKDCPVLIKSAFDIAGKLADQGTVGLKKLSSTFRLCSPMTQKSEVSHLYGWIRNAFTYQAMLDYPYATSFIGHLPGYPVNVSCELMLKNKKNLLEGLAEANAISYNGTGDKKCFDMYAEYMECADPTGCVGSIAWDYQACTEVVLPSGTDGESSMFPYLPMTPEMRKTYCELKYGVTPRTDWLNVNMWGQDLNYVTNIVFTNGALDPWQRGGLTKPIGSVEYYLIEQAAHHLDLRGSHSKDPQSVIDVRKKELQAIRRWLQKGK